MDTRCEAKNLTYFSRIVEAEEVLGTFNGLTGLSWTVPEEKSGEQEGLKTGEGPTTTGQVVEDYPIKKDTTDNPITEDTTMSDVGSTDSLESLPKDTISLVAELTTGQSSAQGDIWKLLRQKRLTASLFGVVLQVKKELW